MDRKIYTAFIMRSLSLCILALFVTLSLLVSGCGRKRAPVPPGTLRPERIKDLSYKIVPEGVILKWSVPRRNHDGSPLSRIKEFLLYKAETPLDSVCLTCPPKYGSPIVIKYGRKPKPGEKIVYEDTTVRKGYYYVYQVKTVKGLFNVSDFSNKVAFAWHSPPGPPLNLSANVLEDGVELKWLPPTSFTDGEPLDDAALTYRLYRKFSDETKWTPLPGTTAKTTYFDKIRRTYRQVGYRVAAIFRYFDTDIEGLKSAPVIVKARGLQNIPAPRNVRVSKAADGILISWNSVRRPGIIGYYIYRLDPSGLVVQLNMTPVPEGPFVDKTLLPPGKYTYWVTAIDDSYPPNQSRPSKPVSIIIK